MNTEKLGIAPGLQLGVIRWYDDRPEKKFGFIYKSVGAPKEQDVFFHRNDEGVWEKGKNYPSLVNIQASNIMLYAPMMVVFSELPGKNGRIKARPWTFWHDYQRILLETTPRPLYRVVGEGPQNVMETSLRPLGNTSIWRSSSGDIQIADGTLKTSGISTEPSITLQMRG